MLSLQVQAFLLALKLKCFDPLVVTRGESALESLKLQQQFQYERCPTKQMGVMSS